MNTSFQTMRSVFPDCIKSKSVGLESRPLQLFVPSLQALTVKRKWFLCLLWTVSVKCWSLGWGRRFSSSRMSKMPTSFDSTRSETHKHNITCKSIPTHSKTVYIVFQKTLAQSTDLSAKWSKTLWTFSLLETCRQVQITWFLSVVLPDGLRDGFFSDLVLLYGSYPLIRPSSPSSVLVFLSDSSHSSRTYLWDGYNFSKDF